MKRILTIIVLITLMGCNKQDETPDYGPMPSLKGTTWRATRQDELGYTTKQTVIFISDSTGTFETTPFGLKSGPSISGFKEDTKWSINGDRIYVHFERGESKYFPEDMYGTYKRNNDGVPVLDLQGHSYTQR